MLAKCWVGQKVHLVYFHQIKGTFLIFTKNLIDLDILCRLSSDIGFLWVEARGAAKHLPMSKRAPQQKIIWPKCQ